MKPSIVIADDHPLLLKGLREFLEEAGYRVLAAARSGMEALAAIKKQQPDVVILDISLPPPDGLELALLLRQQKRDCKVLILSLYENPGYIARAKSIPVDGYLLKEDAMQELILAIEEVMAGGCYFSARIDSKYRSEVSPLLTQINRLSQSELKIIRAIADGKSTQQIAQAFFLSPRTVQKHRENIRRKLNLVASGESLDAWAMRYVYLLGLE